MDPARPPRSRTARVTPSKRSSRPGGAATPAWKQKLRAIFTPRVRRVLKWGAIAALAMTAILSATIAITFWVYSKDLPSVSALREHRFKEATKIVVAGKDGRPQLIGELGERRTVVTFDEIPPLVRDAFVVAEDAGFWDHAGIDYRGMARAFFVNLFSGEARQGASTITQQVVKNLLLTRSKSFKRKMQEIILARRLENELSKEEILALYLNLIDFGGHRFGVAEAARWYFGKPLDQLDAGEAAYLAALPQNPYKIAADKEWAANRREYVLNQLVAHGKITEQVARDHVNDELPEPSDPSSDLAPEVVDLVERELKKEHGADLDTLGAEVRVTVRPDVQEAAREALRDRLRVYDKKHKIGVALRKVDAKKIDAELAKLGKKLPRGGPALGERYPAIVTGVDDDKDRLDVDLGGWRGYVNLGLDADRLNPKNKAGKRKKASERFAAGDVVEVTPLADDTGKAVARDGDVGRLRFPPGPEGAVVAIDVKTRKLVAMVGGFAGRRGLLNRAVQSKRQPGSTFKPFVYAAALQTGRYTAASIVNDAPDVYDLYKPKNYGTCCEGPVRLRHALAKSHNTVAIRVAHDIGPDAIAATAHAMGVESALPPHLSLALGSGEVTALELTNAFATFAAGGVHRPVRIIDAIDGQLTPDGASTQAIPAEIAYVVADMMRSVLEPGGTGGGAHGDLKVPAVGKTGTSDDERDAWFVGIAGDLAIGIWVGYDDNTPLGAKQTGGAVSLPVFVDVVNRVKPRGKLSRPPGVVEVRIDKVTGLRAADGAPAETVMTEVFVAGSEPTEIAPLPGEVDTTTFVTDEYDDAADGAGAPEPAPEPAAQDPLPTEERDPADEAQPLSKPQ